MFFRQIKHRGDNFSYVIADDITKEAVVVDPSFNADTIIKIIKEQNLNLKYIIDTHHHMDHIAGNEDIRSGFSAKVVAHKLAKSHKDISVVDGHVIKIGKVAIKVIHTSGHSPTAYAY